MFFLAYHLHWSHSEAVNLPVSERWAYITLLADQLEREQQAVEEART